MSGRTRGAFVPAAMGLVCATAAAVAWIGASADAEVGPSRVTTTELPTVAPGPALATPDFPATSLDSGVGTTAASVDPGWVRQVSAQTGIGLVALTAYANAALRLTDEQPACRLGWTTLAGIGWVESQHGTLDGNALRPDGTTRRPILGPALDGTGGVAALSASPDDTADHGNATWDHAVGPMQFIGSTWRRWGDDADEDGHADRSDVDDASYAAARYLCANGDDLTAGSAWTAAVRSYNHSDSYVASVLDAANAYAARSGG